MPTILGDDEAGAMTWIDVSVPLREGMVHWPDNPPVLVRRQLDRDRGDPCNVSAMSFGAHSGPHLDAPIHFIDAARRSTRSIQPWAWASTGSRRR